MGRLDKLDFEDVFGRDKKIMRMNAHDVYLSQFDWSIIIVYSNLAITVSKILNSFLDKNNKSF